MFLSKSIRWRIAIPYAGLIILILAGLGVFLSNNFRQIRLRDLGESLLVDARLVGEVAAPLMEEGEESRELGALANRWATLIEGRVTILAADGTVLAESHDDPAQMDNHLNRPEIQEALAAGEGRSMRLSQTIDLEMMYSAVRLGDAEDPAGFVRVALPLEQIETGQSQVERSFIVAIAVGALMAIILGTLISWRTTLPLQQLLSGVQKLAEGELKEPLTPATSDEVGQLTRSFNAMAERLRTQFDRLETERAKLAAVLHQMTDGVLMVDEAGRLQLMNAAAAKMFDVPEEEGVGKTLVEVVRHHQLVELWRQSRQSGEEQVTSLEFNPNQSYLQVVALPFQAHLAGHVLLILQDLTNIRRLETIRRDFVSNISHELRTPLASLKALVETLRDGALQDKKVAHRFLVRMENEVDSLTQMVHELLELSRIESGKVPLQFQPILPRQVLESGVDRLRLQAERAQVKIIASELDELPEVLADPPRIEQVVVNLLHNAIKFTPTGGEIHVGAARENGEVVFKIVDTGVGIPADDLPRIFERFYKTDRARSGGGTGLGLAIARHLVEAHGGRIWAKSVEGQGSTFYFTLPSA